MASTQRYLHARTPFGIIIRITDRVYKAEATVKAGDGRTRTYRLPFLIAHGVTLAHGETDPRPRQSHESRASRRTPVRERK